MVAKPTACSCKNQHKHQLTFQMNDSSYLVEGHEVCRVLESPDDMHSLAT